MFARWQKFAHSLLLSQSSLVDPGSRPPLKCQRRSSEQTAATLRRDRSRKRSDSRDGPTTASIDQQRKNQLQK
jgi:hypothetical protein